MAYFASRLLFLVLVTWLAMNLHLSSAALSPLNPYFRSPTHVSDCAQVWVRKLANAAIGDLPYMFIPFKEVRTCINAEKMPADIALEVYDATKVTLMLYTFKDSATESTRILNAIGEMFVSSNVPDAFGRLLRPTWKTKYEGITELEFNFLIAHVFSSAKDGHFTYVPPPVFSGIWFPRPYRIRSRNYNTSMSHAQEVQDFVISGLTSMGALMKEDGTEDAVYTPYLNQVNDFYSQPIESLPYIVSFNGLNFKDVYLPYSVLQHYTSAAKIEAALTQADEINYGQQLLFIPGSLLLPSSTIVREILPSEYSGSLDTNTAEDILTLSDGSVLRFKKYLQFRLDSAPTCPSDDQGMDSSSNLKTRFSPSVDGTAFPSRKRTEEEAEDFTSAGSSTKDPSLQHRFGPFANEIARTLVRWPWVVQQSKEVKAGKQVQSPDEAAAYRAMLEDLGEPDYSSKGFFDGYVDVGKLGTTLLRIHSFYPTSNFTNSYVDDQIQKLNDWVQHRKWTNLVIDVRGNGGGYKLLEELMLLILFPSFHAPPTRGYRNSKNYPNHVESFNYLDSKDFADHRLTHYATPIQRVIAERSTPTGTSAADRLYDVLGPYLYASLLNNTLNITGYPHDWYYNGFPVTTWWSANRAQSAGLSNSYLTPKFSVPFFFTASRGYNELRFFMNVTIFTDSRCASACSSFIARIRENALTALRLKQFKVITVGGLGGRVYRPVQESYAQGGIVRDIQCLNTTELASKRQTTFSPFLFIGRKERLGTFSGATKPYYPINMQYNSINFYSTAHSEKPLQKEENYGNEHWYLWPERSSDEEFEVELLNRLYPQENSAASYGASLRVLVICLLVAVLFGAYM